MQGEGTHRRLDRRPRSRRAGVVPGVAALLVGLACTACGGPGAPLTMSVDDALSLPRPPADLRSSYGDGPQQYGELRLPGGPGPHPTAVILHGGCWLAAYDLGYMASLAAALTELGVATWSLEYRRVGDPGGGWPGTFADVAAGADHLRSLARDHHLDLGKVVAVGHSAGGHLALWLAARRQLPEGDLLRGGQPLPLVGAVSLAGIPDLADFAAPTGCGAAVSGLLGDDPSRLQERLARSSPILLVPLGVPQVLVIGSSDEIVPRVQADRYVTAARGCGDRVRVVAVAGAGHFELVDPGSEAWPFVRGAVAELLGAPRVSGSPRPP